MQVKTRAIVVSAIRYAEADLIVKMYTEHKGLVSYMVKGVLKSKKGKFRGAFFQTGLFLEVDAIHKPKNNLHILKEVKPLIHFKSLHSNIIKSSTLTFLLEIINQVLIDEAPDEDLFNFFYNSFLWLDDNENIALFHIVFLIKLTSFLGCYPDESNMNFPAFDLESATFVPYSNNIELLSNELLTNFKLLLGTEFDELKTISIVKSQRKDLLQMVLKYYSYHVAGYREPKSLLVLEQLFN